MKKIIPVKELTSEDFKLFGEIIEQPTFEAEVNEGALSYWHEIYKDKISGNITMGFLQIRKQEMVVKNLEKHDRYCEIFIPVGGSGIMAFAPALNDTEPDLDKIVAFRIDGTKAILVNKGVWHLPALPLIDKIDFLMVLPGNILNDIHKTDIDEMSFDL